MDVLQPPRCPSHPPADFQCDAEPLATASSPTSAQLSPHRSPKGPRPVPSSFHSHSVEPARIPLPVDVDESLCLANNAQPASVRSREGLDLVEDTHDGHSEPPRNVQDGLSTSFFPAASTPPPPFARTSRATSISSVSTSSHHNLLSTPTAPDPWVAPAALTSHVLISPESDLINSTPPFQSLGRSAVIGPPVLTPGIRNSDGSDLTLRSHRAGNESPIKDNEGEDVLSNPAYEGLAKDRDGDTTFKVEETKEESATDLANAVNNLTLSRKLGTEGTDTNTDPNVGSTPSSNHTPVPMYSMYASVHRANPMPLDIPTDTQASNDTEKVSMGRPTTSSAQSIPTPPSPTIHPLTPTFNVVGSCGTSSFLAESATWEKVEGINDEWTELSNPKEDVLVMEESEESDEEDMDDEEWEDSRKVKSVADSGFLPSVERRRRMAAQQHQQQALTPTGDGSVTPRGARSPSPSRVQKSNVISDYRRLVTDSSQHASRSNQPAPTPRLTPQQEHLVAELKKARSTRSTGTIGMIGSPFGKGPEQANRKIVSLTGNW